MIKRNISFILIILLAIFFCAKKINVTSSIERGNYGVIDWDNFGYYLYLPACFIHKDITLKEAKWAVDAQKKYSLSSNFYQAHHISNGNRVIQYTSGMAIIYSPAFFTGHVLAKISQYEADGFSLPPEVFFQSLKTSGSGAFHEAAVSPSARFFDMPANAWSQRMKGERARVARSARNHLIRIDDEIGTVDNFVNGKQRHDG